MYQRKKSQQINPSFDHITEWVHLRSQPWKIKPLERPKMATERSKSTVNKDETEQFRGAFLYFSTFFLKEFCSNMCYTVDMEFHYNFSS